MTAVESCVNKSSAVAMITAEGYFRKEIHKYPIIDSYVTGGELGISLMGSKMEGDYIRLSAEYILKVPAPFLPKKLLFMKQNSTHRKWTGKNSEIAATADYAYYTDTGTVYHTTLTCSYLDLSIKAVPYSKIEHLRNKSGHKYYECSCTAGKTSGVSTVYITDYGTRFHSTLDCSGLKRTIHRIKISEADAMPFCSKCKS